MFKINVIVSKKNTDEIYDFTRSAQVDVYITFCTSI